MWDVNAHSHLSDGIKKIGIVINSLGYFSIFHRDPNSGFELFLSKVTRLKKVCFHIKILSFKESHSFLRHCWIFQSFFLFCFTMEDFNTCIFLLKFTQYLFITFDDDGFHLLLITMLRYVCF